MSNTKFKVFVATALIAVIGSFSFLLVTNSEPKPAVKPAVSSHWQKTPATIVNYRGIESKNALELLKQQHRVTTKTYEGLGEMVTSIDGVAADSKHFWSLYVNGRQSQVGAAAYITHATDTITWKLEGIHQ